MWSAFYNSWKYNVVRRKRSCFILVQTNKSCKKFEILIENRKCKRKSILFSINLAKLLKNCFKLLYMDMLGGLLVLTCLKNQLGKF